MKEEPMQYLKARSLPNSLLSPPASKMIRKEKGNTPDSRKEMEIKGKKGWKEERQCLELIRSMAYGRK